MSDKINYKDDNSSLEITISDSSTRILSLDSGEFIEITLDDFGGSEQKYYSSNSELLSTTRIYKQDNDYYLDEIIDATVIKTTKVPESYKQVLEEVVSKNSKTYRDFFSEQTSNRFAKLGVFSLVSAAVIGSAPILIGASAAMFAASFTISVVTPSVDIIKARLNEACEFNEAPLRAYQCKVSPSNIDAYGISILGEDNQIELMQSLIENGSANMSIPDLTTENQNDK